MICCTSKSCFLFLVTSSAFALRSQDPQISKESERPSEPQETSIRTSSGMKPDTNLQKEDKSAFQNDLLTKRKLKPEDDEFSPIKSPKMGPTGIKGAVPSFAKRLKLQGGLPNNDSTVVSQNPLESRQESSRATSDEMQDTEGILNDSEQESPKLVSGKAVLSVVPTESRTTASKTVALSGDSKPKTESVTKAQFGVEVPSQDISTAPGVSTSGASPTRQRLQESLGLLDPSDEGNQNQSSSTGAANSSVGPASAENVVHEVSSYSCIP